MKRKRYEVRGMMEWHPVFRVGRTQLQVSFTGGCLCGGANTPATFETADPVVQAVIEGSAAFKSKRIRLGAVMDDGEADAGRLGNRLPIIPSETFEYGDTEDIFEFLKYQKNVPQNRLMTPDSCFDEAKKLGIELKKKEARQ